MLHLMVLIDLGNSQFKPAITDCSVESIGYKHMVTLNWTLLNENYYLGIREYWIYCNCSDYETDFTKVCIYVCMYVCQKQHCKQAGVTKRFDIS